MSRTSGLPCWATGSGVIRSGTRPARAAATSSALAGAIERSDGSSPASVTSTAGARSHRPRQGLSSQIAWPLPGCSPAGPTVRWSSATSSSLPRHMQPMSVHTWATTGGRGSMAKSA
jgi:hypothetical protein